VGWRVGFVISAVICLLPLLALPAPVQGVPSARPDRAFIHAALATTATWRLLALFVAANGVPLIVGAWLVAYLTRHVDLRSAVAGVLGFAVFGLTTIVRPIGGRMARRAWRYGLLAGAGSLLAASGLVVLAASSSLGAAVVAVLLMGVGFALPYAVMMDAAQRLFPDRATTTLALVQTGPNVVPIFVIPLVGLALGDGRAPLAFVLLAAFVAAAGALNLSAPSASIESTAMPIEAGDEPSRAPGGEV
jgi:predicted MFS family arabinose efflux permease